MYSCKVEQPHSFVIKNEALNEILYNFIMTLDRKESKFVKLIFEKPASGDLKVLILHELNPDNIYSCTSYFGSSEIEGFNILLYGDSINLASIELVELFQPDDCPYVSTKNEIPFFVENKSREYMYKNKEFELILAK